MLGYVFRMESYGNPSKTLVVPELTKSVDGVTNVWIVYSTNAVCYRVHRFPMTIQLHRLEQIAVDIHKVIGRTMHVFVHVNLLDAAVVTAAAVNTVVSTGLVLLFLVSL